MQIIELEVGETHMPAPGIRVTVLSILGDGARLQIDAPAHVLITIGNPPDISLLLPGEDH